MPIDKGNFWKRVTEAYSTEVVSVIAKDVGEKVQTLYKWQKGTIPKLDILMRISDSTGVSIHWLLTERGSKYVNDPVHIVTIEQITKQLIEQLNHLPISEQRLYSLQIIHAITQNSENRPMLRAAAHNKIIKAKVDTPLNERGPTQEETQATAKKVSKK